MDRVPFRREPMKTASVRPTAAYKCRPPTPKRSSFSRPRRDASCRAAESSTSRLVLAGYTAAARCILAKLVDLLLASRTVYYRNSDESSAAASTGGRGRGRCLENCGRRKKRISERLIGAVRYGTLRRGEDIFSSCLVRRVVPYSGSYFFLMTRRLRFVRIRRYLLTPTLRSCMRSSRLLRRRSRIQTPAEWLVRVRVRTAGGERNSIYGHCEARSH
ncbi:hypothetical protein V9T40_007445 [Parthenolecanium corni]|uniref:Uncharacterized protein n=1 Tax=Parthenolecanium corni TaxID=536013 RepID=A0AAN9TVB7_9HEMI